MSGIYEGNCGRSAVTVGDNTATHSRREGSTYAGNGRRGNRTARAPLADSTGAIGTETQADVPVEGVGIQQ